MPLFDMHCEKCGYTGECLFKTFNGGNSKSYSTGSNSLGIPEDLTHLN